MHTPPLRPRSKGRVTLAEVALAAGVSPMTASRVLREEKIVSLRLQQQVKKAAQILGYTPDFAARSLASKHSDHIAVLVPMLSNNLFVDVLEAIQLTLRPTGYKTLIGITHYNQNEEELYLREQLQHRPAGILISGFDHNNATTKILSTCDIPCVHMMELLPDTSAYCVGFSQTQAAMDLTSHLISRGYQRIAFVAAQLDVRTLQRLQGWKASMHKHNLYTPDLEYLQKDQSSMALGAKMLTTIVQNPFKIDAVFFCNDDLAQGALLAAHKMHIPVPQHIAIAGFNDLTGSDLFSPSLTTVKTLRTQIGQKAAEMLLALLNKTEVNPRQINVGYELVIRNST